MGEAITILGAGSWGTSVATLLASNGHDVIIWSFEEDVAEDICKNNANEKFLPGIKLDKKIRATSSMEEAIAHSEIIFEAVPVLFLRNVLSEAKPYVGKDHRWVVLSKGIENDTLLFPSQMISDVLGFSPVTAIFGGPNFADQVANKDFSGAVIACKDADFGRKVKLLCESKNFFVETSGDEIGVQVGGALKNVLSVFLGLLDGAKYTENTRAFLLAKSFEEMVRFAKLLGAKRKTIWGVSGLGDLVLGFLGKKTRNYEIGVALGRGQTLAEISHATPVLPEGINAIRTLHQIMEQNSFDFFILKTIYEVIFDGKPISSVLADYKNI